MDVTDLPPARKKRPSPWPAIRAEYPGARIVRFIDLVDGSQEFKPIATDDKLVDGMTIVHPSWPERSRTEEEWNALIATFDERWHLEQEASQCPQTA